MKGIFPNDWVYRTVVDAALHKSIRKAVMPLALKSLENAAAGADRSGLDYVVRAKGRVAANLVRGLVRNLDRGFISQHSVRTILDTLAGSNFSRPALGRARSDYLARFGIAPPAFVVLSPTQRCNLNCIGCYAGSTATSRDTLPYQVCRRLLNEMRDELGSNFVVFSGGEPFSYQSGGRGLLDLAREFNDTFMMSYTNGLLIDDRAALELGDLGNLSPAISIEGREEETDHRRGKGVFRRILATFDRLKANGVPFGVSITATRQNFPLLCDAGFYEYCYQELGASYVWMFHLMPIGRAATTMDLMLTPAERKRLFETWERLTNETEYFVGDFWNSGTVVDGCIAYGRPGGYFYVNWNGNVTPCAFVPYYKDNLVDLYAAGKSITDALASDLFVRGRNWQQQYRQGAHRPGNMIAPCSIRDHYANFRANIMAPDVKPENEFARQALEDPEYYERLSRFGSELETLTAPMWQARCGNCGGKGDGLGGAEADAETEAAEQPVGAGR